MGKHQLGFTVRLEGGRYVWMVNKSSMPRVWTRVRLRKRWMDWVNGPVRAQGHDEPHKNGIIYRTNWRSVLNRTTTCSIGVLYHVLIDNHADMVIHSAVAFSWYEQKGVEGMWKVCKWEERLSPLVLLPRSGENSSMFVWKLVIII